MCIYVEMDKDGVFLTTAVLPLIIKYTVVAKWRSPADGVVGLGGLTVQALCLSGYSHYPPLQPPAQLSLHQGAILWLTLENGKRGTNHSAVFCHMSADITTSITRHETMSQSSPDTYAAFALAQCMQVNKTPCATSDCNVSYLTPSLSWRMGCDYARLVWY